MDSIQFTGMVASANTKLDTGVVAMKISCHVKQVPEHNRDKLGIWCGGKEPKVDLVVTTPDGLTVELIDGDLAGSNIDLGSQRLATTIRFLKTSIGEKEERILTALLRYPQKCMIEIKYAQLTFGG